MNRENTMDIVVVGSCMIDFICYADRFPKPGETLEGSSLSIGYGGKGCNQCVAAKKLGADVILISRVGDDSFGKDYVRHLQDIYIPTDFVSETKDVATGMAQITVSSTGENQIVIVPGANKMLCEKDVIDAEDMIRRCKVLVLQMEINPVCTLKAIEIKARGGIGKIILNGAPAVPNLDWSIYALCDVFCVNESEAETFTGMEIKTLEQGNQAVFALLGKGFQEVIITLGEQGALFGIRGSAEVVHIPTYKFTTVDTTGAGDAFIGALAYFTAKFPEMHRIKMIKNACMAAAMSVTKKGTHESFPNFSELRAKGIII